MKSAIIFALLLVVVSTASLDRKSQTQSNGSGDWANGYNCPELLASAAGGDLVVQGAGKFVAPRLDAPATSAEKLGWAFNMANGPQDVLKQIMIKDGSQWYIPFRWISGQASYTNPTGYKYIQFTVTNDNKKNYNFRVNLPYKYFGWYISDDEGTKITNIINKLRSEHQGSINSNKSAATNASNDYLSNKPLLEAANKSDADLKKAQDDANKRLAEIKKQIDANNKERENNDAKLNKLNNQKLNKEKTLTELKQKAITMTSERKSTSDSLKNLKDDSSNKEAAKTRLESAVTVAKSDLGAALDVLKKEAPTRKSDLDEAEKFIEKLDVTNYSKKINMVYP